MKLEIGKKALIQCWGCKYLVDIKDITTKHIIGPFLTPHKRAFTRSNGAFPINAITILQNNVVI